MSKLRSRFLIIKLSHTVFETADNMKLLFQHVPTNNIAHQWVQMYERSLCNGSVSATLCFLFFISHFKRYTRLHRYEDIPRCTNQCPRDVLILKCIRSEDWTLQNKILFNNECNVDTGITRCVMCSDTVCYGVYNKTASGSSLSLSVYLTKLTFKHITLLKMPCCNAVIFVVIPQVH